MECVCNKIINGNYLAYSTTGFGTCTMALGRYATWGVHPATCIEVIIKLYGISLQ